MTLLTLVNNTEDAVGLTRSTTVVGNTTDQTRQLLALANREGKDLARRATWQALTKEFTHTTTAAEDQGAVTTVIGSDFDFLINSTPWDRSQMRPIGGSVSPQVWQQFKAENITGPYVEYRIRGNRVLTIPTPAAGHTLAGEYYSKNWCASSGGTGQAAWAADTDVGVLDEELMTLGLIWRWLQFKGLAYAEHFSTYERQVNDALARDGGKRPISMNGRRFRGQFDIRPAEGSWSL